MKEQTLSDCITYFLRIYRERVGNMISIVIACYNGEKYLDRLLNCFINQTDCNYQLIIVNDGSTDKSHDIIANYQELLPIDLLDTENKGVSQARNTGLSVVKGDYVTFFDCDDVIELDTVEKINKMTQMDHDLIICNYYKNDCVYDQNISIETKEILYRNIIESNAVKGYVWNKIFKTSIIKTNNIRFNKDIRFCEDLLFVCEYVKHIETMKFIHDPYYHYYINDESASKKFFSVSKITSLVALRQCIEIVEAEGFLEVAAEYKEYYYNMVLSLLMHGYNVVKNDKQLLKMFKSALRVYSIEKVYSKRIHYSVILSRFSIWLSYLLWSMVKEK